MMAGGGVGRDRLQNGGRPQLKRLQGCAGFIVADM